MGRRFARGAAFALLISTGMMSASPAWAQGERCAAEAALYSQHSDQPTTVTFHNASRRLIHIYWIDYEGQRRHFSTLRAGQRYSANTFASHPWVVTDANRNCQQVVFAERDTMTFTYR